MSESPAPVTTEPEGLLRELRAVGEDSRRCIRVEFDGAGDVVDVQVTSEALDGNRARLETSVREAVVAATVALREERARHAEAITAAAVRQVGDLTGMFDQLQAQAGAQLDEALAKIAAATERAGR